MIVILLIHKFNIIKQLVADSFYFNVLPFNLLDEDFTQGLINLCVCLYLLLS